MRTFLDDKSVTFSSKNVHNLSSNWMVHLKVTMNDLGHLEVTYATFFVIFQVFKNIQHVNLVQFAFRFPTILQTLDNIADCRTEHERTLGCDGGMR